MLEDRLHRSGPGNLPVWQGPRPRVDGSGRRRQPARSAAPATGRFGQAPWAGCTDADTRHSANLAVALRTLHGPNPEKLRPFHSSAAPCVRAVNRRRFSLSDLRISGGFPCPTLVVDLREGRPSATSVTPPLSKSRLILAGDATRGNRWDGPACSFCTRQRRRGRFPHSNICSQLDLGRRCGRMAIRPTITQPRPARTRVKHMLEPVSRRLDGIELRADGDCRLLVARGSALCKRDCEGDRGHGCRKRPI